ncbi:drug/metabolite transporter (DMT)-like permease [Actinoalloteichus hoggarensis]|uniref:Putative inner membrane transporter yiJE n=1 Tax=Actinoalloteichus hoggarensis TaxID=1470176 RepID=A0A221W2H7_9PSEU|nr:DMT family transporter [Actinoalloteichus hoggarensis]ASO19811.1 putative inner membrane transporter yiJE [Actinoalloteichus hoggarensis]MBB5919481.1 drug/metabolite transporter (DMT)-like permease [Actinoalloteichus hoggarensis]
MFDRTGGPAGMARMGILALLWGSTFLWISVALTGLSPVQVTFVRCVLGTAVVLVWCAVARLRLPRGGAVWRHLLVAAFFCNALPFAMFSFGQQTVDSGVAGVLNATTPLWSLVLGIVLGTERDLRPVRLGGLLVGFVGVLLMFAPWQQSGVVSWGSLAILVAAASYAVGFVYMGRHLVGRGTPAVALAAAQLLLTTGLIALTLPAGGVATVHLSSGVLLAALVLGVCCTGVTFALTYRMIADEGATNTAAVGYLLPVVSVVLGMVVLGEEPGLRVVAGMVVVLIGLGMVRRRAARPPSDVGSQAAGTARGADEGAGMAVGSEQTGAEQTGAAADSAPAPAAPARCR